MQLNLEVWDNNTEISASLDKCYTADLWTARAKKWIADHHAAHPTQPFFMFLAYDTPHAVLELPTQAYPAGGGTNGGLQWLGTPGQMINTASGTIDSWTHPDYAGATYDDDGNAATPQVAWPDVYKRYATSVRRIDDAVGDLKKLLQQLGLDTNTLVVFTSDNGPSIESYLTQSIAANFFDSYGPHDGIKRDTWEGGIRMATLARWPGGIPAGRVDFTPSGSWDWLATFAELAGVAPPARTDGVSLVPTLAGSGTQRPGTLYLEYYEGGSTPSYADFEPAHRGRKRGQMQVVQLGGYKGIRYNIASHTNNFEIYDTLADTKEATNLAPQGAFTALQQQMKDRVLQVRRPDGSAARPYDNEFVPASTNTALTNGVLDYAVYEGDWAWVADDDGDGGPRLLEYALGAQPHIADHAAMTLAPEIVDNHLQVRFPRWPADTSELSYAVQVSPDLRDWTSLTASEVGVEPGEPPGLEEAIFQADPEVSEQSPLYLRLKVNLP